MRPQSNRNFPKEVWTLLEAVCEERLTQLQAQRLEALVLGDADIRRLYVDYLALHGTLHWDAALPTDGEREPGDAAIVADDWPIDELRKRGRSRPAWLRWTLAGLAACLFLTVGAFAHRAFFAEKPDNRSDLTKRSEVTPAPPAKKRSTEKVVVDKGRKTRKPIHRGKVPKVVVERKKQPQRAAVIARRPRFRVPAGGSSLESVVAFVDFRLKRQWEDEGIEPSKLADDFEWVRRVHIDLIGRIPTVQEVEEFLNDPAPNKRRRLIDRLLADPKYVRHSATVWSNLLVGRKPSRDVNRPALEKFLRDSFAQNRPWKDVVIDLIAAKGSVDENGAANFLVAHLNNQAVPATAVTARLFLGMQVQCTQCHNHPFNDWKQSQFWELNSFFKQAATQRKRTKSGKVKVELINRKKGGLTYYDTRNQFVHVAFPRYGKTKISLDPEVDRRAELAKLLFDEEGKQVARAIVNRMWARFFGYGFTRPIDDMGPHNPPSHPELLDRLTEEFVASGYNMKQLIRWICNSRAYQLTSRFNETNSVDAPETGNLPLFSRMYVKAMSAEQLYDSLLTATRAHQAAAADWNSVERNRRQWLQQFFQAYQTEENDEQTTFDGTIPQALLMMNSDLVSEAVSNKRGTYFYDVLTSPGNDMAKARKLALAALSREPTKKEADALRQLFRKLPRGTSRRAANAQLLQDLFWAYLNSNEFILIH